MRTVAILVLTILTLQLSAFAVTVKVPGDYPTIQAAINAVPGNNDLILVQPKTYNENINFLGKAITVRSDQDLNAQTFDIRPFQTTINAGESGSAVVFVSGEGEDSVLQGFTLTKGQGTKMGPNYYGGGIFCAYDSSPTIMHCVIRDNKGDETAPDKTSIDLGGGVFSGFGLSADPEQWTHPKLINCVVFRNRTDGNNYGHGAGIACWHKAKVTIINCTVYNNQANSSFGQGGGLWCFDNTEANVHNTIFAENGAPVAHQIWVGTATFPSTVNIEYSLVTQQSGFNPPPTTYVENGCTWTESNVSDDEPKLKNPGALDFGLSTKSSACISKGNNAPIDPYNIDEDINGANRYSVGIKNNGDMDNSIGVVDIGADEYVPFYVPEGYTTIQDAIAHAQSPETILVDVGTYKELVTFLGKSITLKSDKDRKKSTNDPDPENTVLDGSQANCVIKFANGEGNSAKVEGFTITNGARSRGAGIFCTSGSSTPNIVNCIIEDNHATDYGGGAYCTNGGRLKFLGCTIRNNSAGIGGGGFYDYDNDGYGQTTFQENTHVTDNWAGDHGGGIGSYNGTVNLSSNNKGSTYVYENTAPRGGGVYCYGNAGNFKEVYIYNNGDPNNYDVQAGGGIYFEGNCDAKLQRTYIYENHAVRGGGIYINACDRLTMESSAIYKNDADYGGGVYLEATNNVFPNNALHKNSANFEAGGMFIIDCHPDCKIINTIIWDNPAPSAAEVRMVNQDIHIDYCNIRNGGNYPWFNKFTCISKDPLWENSNNPTGNQFMWLTKQSPCINMGVNADSANKCLENNNIPAFGTADIGCYEFKKSNADPPLRAARNGSNLGDNKYEIYVVNGTYYPLELVIDAGTAHANREYLMLGSLSGIAPGLPNLPNDEILPLNWDYLTDLTVSACLYGSPIFVDFRGTLNGTGKGMALMEHDGLLTEDMIGIKLYFAYLLRGGSTAYDMASNPVTLTIRRD